MELLKCCSSARTLLARNMHHGTGTKRTVPQLKFFQKLKGRFEGSKGVPNYLKGNTTDRFLFGTTVCLAVCGVGYSVIVIYKFCQTDYARDLLKAVQNK